MKNYYPYQELIESCQWASSNFLIFSENVFADYIYYSHLFPSLISLIFATFIIIQNWKSKTNQLIFAICLGFFSWSIFDLILWATENPHYTVFFWSIMIYSEILIYIWCLYLIKWFLYKKSFSNLEKIFIWAPIIPLIFLAHTDLNIIGFDLTNCYREALEGPLWYYVYALELIIILIIGYIGLNNYLKTKQKTTIYMTIGLLAFLFALSWSNISGSIAVDWDLSQYGLFGMPIFISFLMYLVVKYQAFNTKLIATQALIISIGFLNLGILFIRNIENVRFILIIILIFTFILGYLVIRSVKKEILIREHSEELAKNLAESNDKLYAANLKLKELDRQKTEFVSIASHQLRAPLTAIKGYSSMLLEGSFGQIPDKSKEAIDVIFQSSQKLVTVIEDFLNVTRIELGRMKYEMTVFDIRDLTEKIIEELMFGAKKKNLKLNLESNRGAYQVYADYGKINQVITNVIDNAIKYTPKGEINVKIYKPENDPYHIRIEVKDQGVGIDPQSIPKLFQKFIRADEVGKTHISGTGLGLYVAKQIMEAHKGKIWVESEGEGKGSTFYIEILEYGAQDKAEEQKEIENFADSI